MSNKDLMALVGLFNKDKKNKNISIEFVSQVNGILTEKTINNTKLLEVENALTKTDNNDFVLNKLLLYFHLKKEKEFDISLKALNKVYSNVNSDDNYELIRNLTAYFDIYPEELVWIVMDKSINLYSGKSSKEEYFYYLKGLKEYFKEDYESAIDYFMKTLFLDKSFWLAYSHTAISYFILKDYDIAINYFLKLIEKPKNINKEVLVSSYFYLSYCYSKSKDFENEQKYLLKCLKLNPKFIHANNNMGYSLLRMKKYTESLKYLDKSIELGTDDIYPYWNKVRVLKATGKYDQALDILEIIKTKSKSQVSIKNEIEKIQNLKSKKEVVVIEELTEQEDNNEHEVEEKYQPKKEIKNSSGIQIAKESILEDLIVERIKRGAKTFGRNLKIYNGEYNGRQYPTIIGRMDILTQDIDDNTLVILELKRGKSDDEVVGQISRYLSWVAENLAKKGQAVKGIICIKQASLKLKYAAKSNPNIELFEYEFDFNKIN